MRIDIEVACKIYDDESGIPCTHTCLIQLDRLSFRNGKEVKINQSRLLKTIIQKIDSIERKSSASTGRMSKPPQLVC